MYIVRVGCPDCLDKLNNSALNKTVAFGWWGFPWGVIRSIQAITLNIKSKHSNHMDSPNQFLRSFVLFNIGQLVAFKEDLTNLRHIISKVE